MHILVPRMGTWARDQKNQNFQNSNYNTAALSWLNLSEILSDFGTNLVRRSRITHWFRSGEQNCKLRKFKMADCCHFEKFCPLTCILGTVIKWQLLL